MTNIREEKSYSMILKEKIEVASKDNKEPPHYSLHGIKINLN